MRNSFIFHGESGGGSSKPKPPPHSPIMFSMGFGHKPAVPVMALPN
jgi:hypothetical protein